MHREVSFPERAPCKLSECRRIPAQTGANPVEIAQIWVNPRRFRPKWSRTWSNASVPKIHKMWADIDHFGLESTNSGPSSTDVDRTRLARPKSEQDSAKFDHTSTAICPISAGNWQTTTILARNRPALARLQQNPQPRSAKFDKFGPESANSGPSLTWPKVDQNWPEIQI